MRKMYGFGLLSVLIVLVIITTVFFFIGKTVKSKTENYIKKKENFKQQIEFQVDTKVDEITSDRKQTIDYYDVGTD